MRAVLALPALCLAAGGLACAHLPPPRSGPPAGLQAHQPAAALPVAPHPAGPAELHLTLPAATYVRLAILSTSPDLVVRQLGPDGQIAEELHLTGGGIEPTRLSWITARAGEHSWTVAPRNPEGPPGGQAIALEEERPTGPCDAARLRAERAVLAARQELNGPRSDAAAGARALLEPAAAAAAAAGERETALAVQLELARTAARQQAADPAKPAGPENPETPENSARLFERALELARAIGDRQAEADALQGLADLLPEPRNLESLRAALEIRRQLGDELGQAYLLHLIGYYHKSRGEPAAAQQSYLEALALQWRNDDASNQAWTLGELGALYGRQGDPDRARDYLGVGFERGKEAGDLEAQAFALRESARLDIDLGELQTAYREYVQAQELVAAGGSGTELAWALEGVAASLMYLGEPGRARQKYSEALSGFTAQHDLKGQAWALLGIGSALTAEHDDHGALESFGRALDLVRATGIQGLEGLALYDLGRVHRDLHQPQEAISELERAVTLEAADSRLRQAQAMVELASAYGEAGDAARADAGFRRAVQLSSSAPVVEAAAQAGLARLERDRGDLTAARSAIARAIEITEKLRAGVIRPDQSVTFLASRRSYYEFYVDLLMRLHLLEPGAGHDAEALAASEQARARGLLDLLAKERVDVRHGIPEKLKQRETEVGARIAQLQTRLWSESQVLPEKEIQRLGRELEQAEEEERELDAEIRRSQPAYADLRTTRPLPLAEIQAILDGRTTLLEFFVAEKSSYLFVVTHGGLAVHPLPPRAEILPLVDSVNAAVQRDTRLHTRRYVEDAYRLYRLLVQPAAGELREKLLVAPDGLLYSLSFEALLTGPVPAGDVPLRGLPYLIRERSVSYIPSASVLARLLSERRRSNGVAAGGKLFVGFGDPGEGSRRPLPAARNEVLRIASLFPAGQAVVFLGADASEENLKTSTVVTAARRLHFASHGLLDETSPERSGLQLAHASPLEDGLLQARDVFNLELHADLVVLSACKTGLGKEVSGEGLIGMARAFLYAGAGSILVSLWQVDDESTSDLMVSFYRHLQELGDKSEALRRAKIEAIDRSRYVHPYFWAPFILVGLPE
jgi:CHAT domain-containing protein